MYRPTCRGIPETSRSTSSGIPEEARPVSGEVREEVPRGVPYGVPGAPDKVSGRERTRAAPYAGVGAGRRRG